ncbi:hypothetical protein EVAR_67164_1 [Eumeta japonica]|uniref:Kinesin motor domain-containing protein n=1 Tax=Eumeta variegata TaxID=151549 RepID=A0A4C1ZY33_EUMVA|nr:hypothetical protein EVAR_67164_1 [Eumeta japonica]
MEKSSRPRTALNECVKVVVRCRPLSEKEKLEGYDENEAGSRPAVDWRARSTTREMQFLFAGCARAGLRNDARPRAEGGGAFTRCRMCPLGA